MKKILFAAVLFTRTQVLMGNVPVTLTIEAPRTKQTQAYTAMQAAFEKAKAVEQQVSEFIFVSQTSGLNRKAGKDWVQIGEDLKNILLQATKASEATDGAFDVTFASKNKKATYRDIIIDREKSRVRFGRSGVTVKVSGLAKGFIVDQMGRVLGEKGFKKYLVNAGGEVFAKGEWDAAIRNPDNPDGPPLCTLKLRDQAASTSGLYERGAHIIDPKNHKPVLRDGSVTVIAPTSFQADSFDNAAFLMGKEKLNKIRDRFSGMAFVFVERGKIETVGKVKMKCR